MSTDRKTDEQCHTTICPFFGQAYKKTKPCGFVSAVSSKEALPNMLLQMAGFLVGLTAVLALVRPFTAHHIQVLLKGQAGVLGRDKACSKGHENIKCTGSLFCICGGNIDSEILFSWSTLVQGSLKTLHMLLISYTETTQTHT